MKKLAIVLAAIAILIGCQKESETTYTINVNIGYQHAALTQGLSYNADILINEYGNGKKLTTQHIEDINEEVDYVYEPNPKTEYVTVKYTVEVGDEFASFWVGKIYDIVQGKNTQINIVYTTIAVKEEPKR